ncbi:MAG: acyl carrier protein [Candidatus Parcubacteria bacterium]|nr:acyl carrier protein [Candidatus Parcubacteria bacterium]
MTSSEKRLFSAKAVEEKVIEIVADQIQWDGPEITPGSSFVADLNVDSLDTVELVTKFEDEFGINIPDEKVDGLQTVRQTMNYIKAELKKQNRLSA